MTPHRLPTLEETRALVKRGIAEKRIQVQTGEGTQQELDDLLDRLANIEELHAFVCIVHGGGAA